MPEPSSTATPVKSFFFDAFSQQAITRFACSTSVSDGAKNLIQRMLTVDPEKRITAKEALDHSWIVGSGEELRNSDLGLNLTKFKEFNAKRKFKSVVKAVSSLELYNRHQLYLLSLTNLSFFCTCRLS